MPTQTQVPIEKCNYLTFLLLGSERPRGHFESYNPRPGYLVCKYKTISNIRNLVFLFPLIVSRFTPLLKPKQSKMIDIITWLNNIKKVATPNLQIK